MRFTDRRIRVPTSAYAFLLAFMSQRKQNAVISHLKHLIHQLNTIKNQPYTLSRVVDDRVKDYRS